MTDPSTGQTHDTICGCGDPASHDTKQAVDKAREIIYGHVYNNGPGDSDWAVGIADDCIDEMVAEGLLAIRHSAALSPGCDTNGGHYDWCQGADADDTPAAAPVPQGTPTNPLLDKLCRRCDVIAAYCPCDKPDLAPLPDGFDRTAAHSEHAAEKAERAPAGQGAQDTDYRQDIAGAIYDATGLSGNVWTSVSDVADEYALADHLMRVRDEEMDRLRDAVAEYDRHAPGCLRERDQLRAEVARLRAELDSLVRWNDTGSRTIERLRVELAEAQRVAVEYLGSEAPVVQAVRTLVDRSAAAERELAEARVEIDQRFTSVVHQCCADMAELRWLHAEAAWQRDAAIDILADLADDSPCVLDGHGSCQGHNWPYDSPCPQKRLREFAAGGGPAEEGTPR